MMTILNKQGVKIPLLSFMLNKLTYRSTNTKILTGGTFHPIRYVMKNKFTENNNKMITGLRNLDLMIMIELKQQ